MPLDREYKIGVPSRQCHTCERGFAVGDEYYSAVVETAQEDHLARHDFCPQCWKPGEAAYFSFWKARVPQPEQPAQRGPRLVDLGRLLQLFERLADSPDEQAQRFRYVLALVLMRKRRLKIVESRRIAGGRGEALVLRETGSERRHEVSCPGISDDEIRSVADRLREILDMPDKWDQLQAGEIDAAAGAAEGAGPAAGPESAGGSQPAGSCEPAAEAAGDAPRATDASAASETHSDTPPEGNPDA